MKRSVRLTRSTDFQRVRRTGKSYAHPLLVLIAAPSEHEDHVRIGITASRSVGGAVVRNRAKRRIRACLEEWIPRLKNDWDLVVVARQPIASAEFQQIAAALQGLLMKAGLLQPAE